MEAWKTTYQRVKSQKNLRERESGHSSRMSRIYRKELIYKIYQLSCWTERVVGLAMYVYNVIWPKTDSVHLLLLCFFLFWDPIASSFTCNTKCTRYYCYRKFAYYLVVDKLINLCAERGKNFISILLLLILQAFQRKCYSNRNINNGVLRLGQEINIFMCVFFPWSLVTWCKV